MMLLRLSNPTMMIIKGSSMIEKPSCLFDLIHSPIYA